MGRSAQEVPLVGYVSRGLELWSTSSCSRMATWSMATSRSWCDQSGETHEMTPWHSVVAFGKLPDIVERFTEQGERVLVDGRLGHTTTDDGTVRTYVVPERVLLLGGAS